MIHADVGIDRFADGGEEGGVGWEGAGEFDSFLGGGVDGGLDDGFFLGAEHAVLAGVGVESEDGEFGGAAMKAGHRFGGEFDDFEDAFGGEGGGDLGKGAVGGDEAAGEFGGGEHHGVTLGSGAFDEDLGVAGVGDAGEGEGFLVEGAGDDAVEVAGEGGIDGVGEVVVGGFSGVFADLGGDEVSDGAEVEEVAAEGEAGGEGDVVEDFVAAEDGEVGVEVGGVFGEEAQTEFRADPGGVSHGDG